MRLRSALRRPVLAAMSLVVALLAVLGGMPLPASAAEPTPPELTVAAPATATFGTDVQLSGHALGLDGVPLTGAVVTITGGAVPVQTAVDEVGAWTAIVAPAHAGLITWSVSIADPALSAQAETTITPATARLTLTAPATSPAGAPVALAGSLTYPTRYGTPATAPVPGATVVVERAADGAWVAVANARTGGDGRFSLTVSLPVGVHHLRAHSAGTADLTASSAPQVTVSVVRVSTVATVRAPASVRSETATTVQAVLSTKSDAPLAGQAVTVQIRRTGTTAWTTLATGRTDASGRLSARLVPWKSTQVRVVSPATQTEDAATSGIITVSTTPAGRTVASPSGAPQPQVRYPQRAQAVGSGAHARVTKIPDSIWARMVGVTWHRGCAPRSSLRLISVNYWGFDGYRYAGKLVVPRRHATKAAAAFTALYRLRYPIRQMVLPETFGRNPAGPGANDYAQMAADNTSGFNCRYVVGKERQKVMSPHANRGALDINTWENPYVTRSRTYPNRWYVTHRPRKHPAVFHTKDAATRALTKRGWTWGGRWSSKDYHHFQR